MLNQAASGLLSGGVYALMGLCLLLSYQVGAVVNFSQAFVGSLAAFTGTTLISTGLSTWEAIVVCVALGTAVAVAQGMVMARFFSTSTVLLRTAVSIGMAVTLFNVIIELFGNVPRQFPSLFESLGFQAGSAAISGPAIVIWALALVVAVTLRLVLVRTRLGVRLRAVAFNAQTAESLGVGSRRYVIGVWAVAGALTSLGIIIVAPTHTSAPAMGLLVAPGLAAALLGAFRSISLTVVGGLFIGIVEALAPKVPNTRLSQFLGNGVPFLVILLVLLWTQRKVLISDTR